MAMNFIQQIIVAIIFLSLSACNYNPMIPDNHLTGSPAGAAIGGGALGATSAWLGAPKSLVALSAIGGASVGYYMTTLRFAAAGIIQAGGQVYTLGEYVGIVIPTDNLFDSNSHEFLPGTEPTLKSIADVVSRYPRQSVIISGNMSGFGSNRFENKLSELRAREIAAYLWAHGLNNFQGQSINERRLIYVGYGNFFPIANNIRLKGIRENSRIQITLYPTNCQLSLDRRHHVFNNIGESGNGCVVPERNVENEFVQDYLPEGRDLSTYPNWKDDMGYEAHQSGQVDYPIPPVTQDYTPDLKGEIENSNKETPAAQSPRPRDYKNEGDLKGESWQNNH